MKSNGAWTDRVEQELKRELPELLVNSRLRADELGNRHFDANGAMMGDFESGYERRLPEGWNTEVLTRDWEACLTIPEHTWGHHAGEWASRTRKDWRDLVDLLAHTVSRGGNLLLNVGPRGDGSFDPDDVQATSRVGSWVHEHPGAIRGAGSQTALQPPEWGWYTLGADGRTHAIITRLPTSNRVRIEAPAALRIEDLRIELEAELVALTPSSIELRLDERPTAPFSCSFVLVAADQQGFSEPNPDAG